MCSSWTRDVHLCKRPSPGTVPSATLRIPSSSHTPSRSALPSPLRLDRAAAWRLSGSAAEDDATRDPDGERVPAGGDGGRVDQCDAASLDLSQSPTSTPRTP